MYKLDASAFHQAILILQQTISRVEQVPQMRGALMGPENSQTSIAMLKILQGHVDVLQAEITSMAIDDLIAQLNGSRITFDGYGQMALTISATFKRELTKRSVYALDTGKSSYFEQPALFGKEVDDAFPSSRFDISEAGKCYALDRPTACVMHLMRALEMPLVLMAGDLGVVAARSAWGELLRDMRPEIAKLPNTHPRQAFYSEAAVQFKFFKNAWRDHAMHAKEKYLPDEALVILNSCKALMRTIAVELHE